MVFTKELISCMIGLIRQSKNKRNEYMENDIIDLLGLMEELIEEKYYYDTEYFFCMGNSPKPLRRLKNN